MQCQPDGYTGSSVLNLASSYLQSHPGLEPGLEPEKIGREVQLYPSSHLATLNPNPTPLFLTLTLFGGPETQSRPSHRHRHERSLSFRPHDPSGNLKLKPIRMAGLTKKSTKALSNLFASKQISKQYIAVCRWTPQASDIKMDRGNPSPPLVNPIDLS